MKRTLAAITIMTTLIGTSALAQTFEDFYQNQIVEKLEIGLRISHFSLLDGDEKRSFDEQGDLVGGYVPGISLGSLDEEQDYLPTIYAKYHFTDYVAVMVAWERLEASALTIEDTPRSDGDLELGGPSIQILGKFPNESIFTPYAGGGFTYMFGDFANEPSFFDNGRRVINADDTLGLMLTAGCSAQVAEQATLDFGLSYLNAETDATFDFEGQRSNEWKFPVDSLIFFFGGTFIF